MTTRTRDWCQTKLVQIKCFPFVNPKGKYKKRQRCPTCNRMLTVILRECHDVGCWHIWFPPHKGKYK